MPPMHMNRWPSWPSLITSSHCPSLFLLIIPVLLVLLIGTKLWKSYKSRHEFRSISDQFKPSKLDLPPPPDLNITTGFHSVHAYLPPPPGSVLLDSPLVKEDFFGLLTSGHLAAKADQAREIYEKSSYQPDRDFKPANFNRSRTSSYSEDSNLVLPPVEKREPTTDSISVDKEHQISPEFEDHRQRGNSEVSMASSPLKQQDSVLHFSDADLGGIWRRRVLEF